MILLYGDHHELLGLLSQEVTCRKPQSKTHRGEKKYLFLAVSALGCGNTYTNIVDKLLSFIAFRFIVRIMCSVLGMHVRQKNPRSRDKNTKLYICNHLTAFDHNIINLLIPCNTVSV